MNTIKLTVGQAVTKFLDSQYLLDDGQSIKYIEGVFTIFGHGNVLGIGEALANSDHSLNVIQGKNEQGMANSALGYAKQSLGRKIYAVTTSVGPGSANLVTSAACATANRIPLLLFPGDVYANRQPDPVLQQIEDFSDANVSTNDSLKPVSRYWDRVSRPEQLMSALINAFKTLTNYSTFGAVTISLPQDVQAEVFDYPVEFFRKREWMLRRSKPSEQEVEKILEKITNSQKPLVILGGGVKFSKSEKIFAEFVTKFNIPFVETQAGKGAMLSNHPLNLGGIGVTGNLAANLTAKDSDLIIAIGTRLSDFTTSSKSLFYEKDIININICGHDAHKQDSTSVVGDAKETIEILLDRISDNFRVETYYLHYVKKWVQEYNRLKTLKYNSIYDISVEIKDLRPDSVVDFANQFNTLLAQTTVLSKINDTLDEDSVIVAAAGSLPGDLERLWMTKSYNSYHLEYGYSCMGYEIAAAVGVKLLENDREVYALVGDGSFQMLHSEIVTAVQENIKINVIVFDNASFGCINNLQMSNGIKSFMTETRFQKGVNKGDYLDINYAMIADGYGLKSYQVHTLEELKHALIDSKKQSLSTLIDIKVLPKTMTNGYESWWNVGLAELSNSSEVERNVKKLKEMRNNTRLY